MTITLGVIGIGMNVVVWSIVALQRWGGGRRRRLESLFVYIIRNHRGSSGYEIAEHARELGHERLTSGEIYPTLQRLITRGWVVSFKGDPHPISGQPRVLYRLTHEGFVHGW